MFKNILLSFGAIIFCLVLVEAGLSLVPSAGRYEKKIEATVDEPKCYANCYTSNPSGYFPKEISVPTSAIFPDAKGNTSSMMTLYCLPYACQARKNGFFPQRNETVYLVGDSFTFGEGVKEEDTLGYQLGLKFPRYNFKNYGETAANLKRVATIVNGLFENTALPTPKNIIYFYNLNDVEMTPALAQQQQYIIDFENIRWSNVKKQENPFLCWLLKFKLARLVEKVWVLHHESAMTIKYYKDIYFSQANASEFNETMKVFDQMNKNIQAKGARFTVVIYPLLFKDVWGQYPFTSIHQSLLSFCHDHHINCIDGLDAFNNDHSMAKFAVHPVDLHPNKIAQKQMVDFLAESYSQQLGLVQ